MPKGVYLRKLGVYPRKPFTEEHKRNMRKPKSDKHCRNISEGHKEYLKTPEGQTQLRKFSSAGAKAAKKALIGKHRPEKVRRKISETMTGKTRSKEAIKNTRKGLMEYFQTPEGQVHLEKFIFAGQSITISQPQRELYYLLKQYFRDAELNYFIRTKKWGRFADVGIPSLKLDVEFDEPHWHKDKQKDHKRDLELVEVGWTTLRVGYEVIEKLSKQGIEVLNGMKVVGQSER